jgi:hypothetical protein
LKELPQHYNKNQIILIEVTGLADKTTPKIELSVSHPLSGHPYVFQKPVTLKVIVDGFLMKHIQKTFSQLSNMAYSLTCNCHF